MASEPRIFDCDNHYYEAADAFTRYVPAAMQPRCLQIAEVEGRVRHILGGNMDLSVKNPLFDPIGPAGSLSEYYRGNPKQLPAAELMRGGLEPQPACYRNPTARLATMDEQGVDAVWLFPTLGVLYEEPIKRDVQAVSTLFEGFNRWLDEDWGLSVEGRIFCAPYISLGDVDWACRELEWALSRDARIVVMRPAAVTTEHGTRSPGDPCFDAFWARVNESGITVAVHTGNSGYSTNGYASDSFGRASIGMSRRPSVKSLVLGRAAYDFLFSVTCDNLFERFPNLRVASIENGSGFLPDLLRNLEGAGERNPWHFSRNPVEIFREHVFISPFWEDNLKEAIGLIGGDRVLFGSDWPHMEGLPHPRDVLSDLDGIDAGIAANFLAHNTTGLTQRRPS